MKHVSLVSAETVCGLSFASHENSHDLSPVMKTKLSFTVSK